MQQLSRGGALFTHFSALTDPRIDRCKRHLLIDIITIAVCAVICGADGWEDMEEFGKAKQEWFSTFLELPNGIPSHDTFSRVFYRIDPRELQACFSSWVEAIAERIDGEIISIDGKTSRRSHDRRSGKAPLHLVSAWAKRNRLVLGQLKTEDKSNEITAIPELLKVLDIKGCLVTIDAMGCQKEIAAQIVRQGGDYVLSLKGNQGQIHKDVEDYFYWAERRGFKGIEHSQYESLDAEHGRVEVRRYYCTEDMEWMEEKEKWEGLRSIGMVESEREENGEVKKERRYYLNSIKADGERFAEGVRGHWGIENSLHWVLDVSFREDESRIRKDNGPENMAVLRQIAVNLLTKEASSKRGVRGKRLKAGWDNRYLLAVLGI